MPIQFKLSYSGVLLVVIGTTIMSVSSCGKNQKVAPPVAKIIPKVDTLFGEVLVDNYYWLRERDNPGVIEYIKAENEYTEAVMRHTKGFQDELYREMLARIKETDMDVPEMIDDYYYYTRSEEGKQYRIYCRKRGSLEAEEEILLDLNEVAKGMNPTDLSITTVKDIMNGTFPIIDPDTPLHVISFLLEYNQAVLIKEKGELKGIICKSDLLKLLR